MPSIKSNSIKSREDIENIKKYLKTIGTHQQESRFNDKRLLYFILGINTCYNVNELLTLKWNALYNDNTKDVREYIEYAGYKFYLNNSCKTALYEYIDKYNVSNIDGYIFDGGHNTENPIALDSINAAFRKTKRALRLPYQLSAFSLRRTFVYWQIIYCKRDYNKISKLTELLNGAMMKRVNINTFGEYEFDNDKIYINDVNL